MSENTTLDCQPLTHYNSFEQYVEAIFNVTGGDLNRVDGCKAEVCGALWGTGNADISGIGMTVGYVLDNALGFILAILSLFGPRLDKLVRHGPSHSMRHAASDVLEAYHSSATFLALSIQVASIVVLARSDFGISASGMGDVTVQLTWTTSVLTLLPLLYCTFIPRLGCSFESATDCSHCQEKSDRMQKKEEYRRECLRHYLFVICWMLSLYPFLSRMIETYGPSKIGDGGGATISNADWNTISRTCHEGVVDVSQDEMTAIHASGITSWLFISILAIASMVGFGVRRNHPDSKIGWVMDQTSLLPTQVRTSHRGTTPVAWVIMFAVPLFSSLQLWAYFRLQRYQQDMSNASGSSDTDSEWGFGQIVALTVFVPVLVEIWYASREWYSVRKRYVE